MSNRVLLTGVNQVLFKIRRTLLNSQPSRTVVTQASKHPDMPPPTTEADQWEGVREADMLDFMSTCLRKAGASTSHADIVAQVLVTADKRGIYSHGINKLGKITFHLNLVHVSFW